MIDARESLSAFLTILFFVHKINAWLKQNMSCCFINIFAFALESGERSSIFQREIERKTQH